jgi:multiple sugar transport system substrate-binding protein
MAHPIERNVSLNSLTWRRRCLGSILLLLLVTMTACGDTTTPSPVGGGATGDGTASGTISFQVFGEPAEAAPFQEVANAYGASHPNVSVKINHIPDQNDYMTRLSAAFTAGNPPDVFLLSYSRYGQFASRGVLEPLGTWLDKSPTLKATDFYTQALEVYTYNGVLQCMPLNISSLTVYYNKDLFQKYNVALPQPGWKWPDFLKTAQALTKDLDGNGTIDIYGVGLDPQLNRLAPFIWAHGQDLVDDPVHPTKLTLDEPLVREVIARFVDLSMTYRVTPTEAETQAEELETRWLNGKLGMFLGARADTAMFRTVKRFTWDVAPIPADETQASILQSEAYCVPAASKNKAAAWDFIQYAAGTEGQTIVAKLGRAVPTLKSVATSPVFLDPTQLPANNQMYLDAIPTIRHLPITPNWPAVESSTDQELERAFYGNVPIDIAIQAAVQKAAVDFARDPK